LPSGEGCDTPSSRGKGSHIKHPRVQRFWAFHLFWGEFQPSKAGVGSGRTPRFSRCLLREMGIGFTILKLLQRLSLILCSGFGFLSRRGNPDIRGWWGSVLGFSRSRAVSRGLRQSKRSDGHSAVPRLGLGSGGPAGRPVQVSRPAARLGGAGLRPVVPPLLPLRRGGAEPEPLPGGAAALSLCARRLLVLCGTGSVLIFTGGARAFPFALVWHHRDEVALAQAELYRNECPVSS